MLLSLGFCFGTEYVYKKQTDKCKPPLEHFHTIPKPFSKGHLDVLGNVKKSVRLGNCDVGRALTSMGKECRWAVRRRLVVEEGGVLFLVTGRMWDHPGQLL